MHQIQKTQHEYFTQFITLKESSILNSEQTQFETILIHVHGYIKFFYNSQYFKLFLKILNNYV